MQMDGMTGNIQVWRERNISCREWTLICYKWLACSYGNYAFPSVMLSTHGHSTLLEIYSITHMPRPRSISDTTVNYCKYVQYWAVVQTTTEIRMSPVHSFRYVGLDPCIFSLDPGAPDGRCKKMWTRQSIFYISGCSISSLERNALRGFPDSPKNSQQSVCPLQVSR